jgi:GntR family transcriptional regulator / MocR family aminotransferase
LRPIFVFPATPSCWPTSSSSPKATWSAGTARPRRATDRFSATLAQEALTDFITTGQFERYLRRAGNRNAAKRRALIGALRQHFGDRVQIAGENTGVHLVVWLNDVRPRDLAAVIARARAAGVGLYSIAPFYTSPPPRAGLLFGYASLSEAEIRAGVRRVAEVV